MSSDFIHHKDTVAPSEELAELSRRVSDSHLGPPPKPKSDPTTEKPTAANEHQSKEKPLSSAGLDFVHDSLKAYASPPMLALAAEGLRNGGMTMALKNFGEGDVTRSKTFGNVLTVSRSETGLTAQKFLALPVAAAAAYSFSRDLDSLRHSHSSSEHAWAAAALVADSVTLAGAMGSYLPGIKKIATPLQVLGAASRVVVGRLDDKTP